MYVEQRVWVNCATRSCNLFLWSEPCRENEEWSSLFSTGLALHRHFTATCTVGINKVGEPVRLFRASVLIVCSLFIAYREIELSIMVHLGYSIFQHKKKGVIFCSLQSFIANKTVPSSSRTDISKTLESENLKKLSPGHIKVTCRTMKELV